MQQPFFADLLFAAEQSRTCLEIIMSFGQTLDTGDVTEQRFSHLGFRKEKYTRMLKCPESWQLRIALIKKTPHVFEFPGSKKHLF